MSLHLSPKGRLRPSSTGYGEVGGESDSERLRVRRTIQRDVRSPLTRSPWRAEDARKYADGSRPLPIGER